MNMLASSKAQSDLEGNTFSDQDLERITEELIKEGAVAPAPNVKSRLEEEHALVHAFLKDPGQHTFMPLFKTFKPWIMKAAQKNMFGSPLPMAAHQALAAQSFLDATKNWDPSKGSFKTYAFSTVFEKGKRLNLKYQNIGYIPESRATKYQAYQTAMHLLTEQFGREPSTAELADELMIPQREVERLRKEVRKDLVLNEAIPNVGPAWAQSDKAKQLAMDIHATLIPKHQVVLEHSLGLYGRTPLVKPGGTADVQAIAKAAKISLNDVRSAQKTISREFRKHRGVIGKTDVFDHVFEESDEG
jgi:hypothetical protein